MSDHYRESGVDTHKAESILTEFGGFLKTRPKNAQVLSGIGPYASCFALKPSLQQMHDPILVTCCDGVGTKSKLALDWGILSGLGQDLVAMNVNDLLCMGALPLVFLDYFATGTLHSEQLLTLLKSIQRGCELAGCSLVGGETAEMPGLYQGKDFDLAGFAVGVVDKSHLLGAEKVQIGDAVIAVGSSGLHSNGFSLVRKVIQKEKLDPEALCPFSDSNWKQVLLAPTLIYTSSFQSILSKLHGLAHITGEGLLGNVPRILPPHSKAVLLKSRCELPPLFLWLQEHGKLSNAEMWGTFNCGIGMVAIAPQAEADFVIHHLKSQGLESWIAGQIEPNPSENLLVEWA